MVSLVFYILESLVFPMAKGLALFFQGLISFKFKCKRKSTNHLGWKYSLHILHRKGHKLTFS